MSLREPSQTSRSRVKITSSRAKLRFLTLELNYTTELPSSSSLATYARAQAGLKFIRVESKLNTSWLSSFSSPTTEHTASGMRWSLAGNDTIFTLLHQPIKPNTLFLYPNIQEIITNKTRKLTTAIT